MFGVLLSLYAIDYGCWICTAFTICCRGTCQDPNTELHLVKTRERAYSALGPDEPWRPCPLPPAAWETPANPPKATALHHTGPPQLCQMKSCCYSCFNSSGAFPSGARAAQKHHHHHVDNAIPSPNSGHLGKGVGLGEARGGSSV